MFNSQGLTLGLNGMLLKSSVFFGFPFCRRHLGLKTVFLKHPMFVFQLGGELGSESVCLGILEVFGFQIWGTLHLEVAFVLCFEFSSLFPVFGDLGSESVYLGFLEFWLIPNWNLGI